MSGAPVPVYNAETQKGLLIKMALQKLGEETSLVETVKSSAQIPSGCRFSKAGTVPCNQ